MNSGDLPALRCFPKMLFTVLLGGFSLLVFWGSIVLPAFAEEAAQLLERAAFEFGQGHYDTAARHYRKALKENPTQPHAYLGLGMALKAQGNLNESRAVLEELIKLYPTFAPAYYNLGEVLESQGDIEGAKNAYRAFIQHSGGQLPKSPEIHIKFRRMGLL